MKNIRKFKEDVKVDVKRIPKKQPQKQRPKLKYEKRIHKTTLQYLNEEE